MTGIALTPKREYPISLSLAFFQLLFFSCCCGFFTCNSRGMLYPLAVAPLLLWWHGKFLHPLVPLIWQASYSLDAFVFHTQLTKHRHRETPYLTWPCASPNLLPILSPFQLSDSNPNQAPEILKGQPLTAASDIWSLGITALELANGSAPYADQPNTKQAITLIIHNPPPRLHGSEWSPQFCDFVAKCLMKKPEVSDQWFGSASSW